MIFAEINFVEKIRRRVRNENFALSVARRKREVVKDFQNEKTFRRFRRLNDKILVQPMNRGDRVVGPPRFIHLQIDHCEKRRFEPRKAVVTCVGRRMNASVAANFVIGRNVVLRKSFQFRNEKLLHNITDRRRRLKAVVRVFQQIVIFKPKKQFVAVTFKNRLDVRKNLRFEIR